MRILTICILILFASEIAFSQSPSMAISFETNHNMCFDAIGLDSNDLIYATGVFSGTYNFGPGWQPYELTSNGGESIFLCKYSPIGQLIWGKSIFVDDVYERNVLQVDNHGNIIIAITFDGDISTEMNSIELNYSSSFYKDCLILKFNSSGDLLWAKDIQRASISQIEVTHSNDLVAIGKVEYTTDLNPNSVLFSLLMIRSIILRSTS